MRILKLFTFSLVFVSVFSFSQSYNRFYFIKGGEWNTRLDSSVVVTDLDSFMNNSCSGVAPTLINQYGESYYVSYIYDGTRCNRFINTIGPENQITVKSFGTHTYHISPFDCPVGQVGIVSPQDNAACANAPPPLEPLCDSELLCVQKAEEDCISRGMTYAMTFSYTDTNNFSYSCASEPETYEPNNSNCIMSINSHCVAFADEQSEDINQPDADLLTSISNNIDQMIDNLSNFPSLDFSSGGVGFSGFTLPDINPDPPDDVSPVKSEKGLTADELSAVLDEKKYVDLDAGIAALEGYLEFFTGDASEYGFTSDYVNQGTFDFLPTINSSCSNPSIKGQIIDICGTANKVKPFLTWGMYLFFLWFLYNEYNNAILWLTRK